MILCDLCAKHHATIYFKGMVSDQTVKLHLCENCAKKRGMVMPFGAAIHSLGEMVARFAEQIQSSRTAPAVSCSACGLSFHEFEQTSQLGCGDCYKTFSMVLGPLLDRIQGSRQHIGKSMKGARSRTVSLQDLARLKLELQHAVDAEAYEKAALIRDQIQEAEKRLKHSVVRGARR